MDKSRGRLVVLLVATWSFAAAAFGIGFFFAVGGDSSVYGSFAHEFVPLLLGATWSWILVQAYQPVSRKGRVFGAILALLLMPVFAVTTVVITERFSAAALLLLMVVRWGECALVIALGTARRTIRAQENGTGQPGSL